jgi:hypothetical protein
MSLGPSIIFDKSALQALNVDESMWLESFFISNITPLFFVETLADLEKEVRNGRTPEDVVGNLALKTPDMGCVNVHHMNLIAGELLGRGVVEMSGRPVMPEGKTILLEGKMGVIFKDAPEVEASKRWEKGEFLDLERNNAKEWRKQLARMGEGDKGDFGRLFAAFGKPNTFEELKLLVDNLIGAIDTEEIFSAWMTQLGIIPEAQSSVLKTWHERGSLPIKEYAPYFSHVISVDLFFYLGSDANLFSQFKHPQTHMIDIAYLYYLPFCNIFTSNDNLHIKIAPIFMRPDQQFVLGSVLKNDFAKLDAYYDALPDDIKNKGTIVFAPCPPDDTTFLTTRLWDTYMAKTWRVLKDHIRKFDGTDHVDPETEKKMTDELKKFVKEGVEVSSDKLKNLDEANHVLMTSMVSSRKGKWQKFPPEVLRGKPIFKPEDL